MRGSNRGKRHVSAQLLLVTMLSGILLPSLTAIQAGDAVSSACPMHGIFCTCPDMCTRKSSRETAHDMNSSAAPASCHNSQDSNQAHTDRDNPSRSFAPGCGSDEGTTLIGENRPIIISGLDTITVPPRDPDRKSTRLNSSHVKISYAVFSLK